MKVISKTELIDKLIKLKDTEQEGAHVDADRLLLDFIADKEIEKAFNEIDKWYA